MTKNITLTIEQAREMLGKDAAIDQLIRANFTEDELKSKYPRTYEDLGDFYGYEVDEFGNTGGFVCSSLAEGARKTYHTPQQAIAFNYIYPQLTQLMARYRDGWEPNWGCRDQPKCCVSLDSPNLIVTEWYSYPQPISFQSREIAQQFIQDHRELIVEFFKGM